MEGNNKNISNGVMLNAYPDSIEEFSDTVTMCQSQVDVFLYIRSAYFLIAT
jgi:hypothetical protein